MKRSVLLALCLMITAWSASPVLRAQELGNPGLGAMADEGDPYGTVAANAGTDDWYSFRGFSIQEAVGCPETGWIVVGQDPTGRYHFLRKGESYGEDFELAEVGTAQVRLKTADSPRPRVLPIVHRNLPADVLVMAVAKLYGYDLTMQGALDKLVIFETGHLDLENELKEIFQGTLHQGRLVERSLLVREGELPKEWKATRNEKETRRFDFQAHRMSAAAIIAQIETQTGYQVKVSPEAAPKLAKSLTVLWNSVSADEAVALLNDALEVKLLAQAPAKVEEEKAPATASAGDEKAERYFRNCLARAKEGRLREAAVGLRKLVTKRPDVARYCNAYGKMLWSLGYKEKAVKAWKRSLRLDPENAYARRVLAKVSRSET